MIFVRLFFILVVMSVCLLSILFVLCRLPSVQCEIYVTITTVLSAYVAWSSKHGRDNDQDML